MPKIGIDIGYYNPRKIVPISFTDGTNSGGGETLPYFSELYSGYSAAYSLKQLDETATVSIRVRRSSDDTEQDIGFVDRALDVSALESFCAATNGYVTKFYHQGGSNHLAQSDSAKQPIIVISGVAITIDSEPMMLFQGTNDYLTLTNEIPCTTPFSCFQNTKRANGSQAAPMLSSSVADAPFALMWLNDGYYYSRSADGTFISTSADTSSSKNILASVCNSTAEYVWNGHYSIPGSNFGGTGVGNFIDFGRRETNYANGYASELIFYPSDETANVFGIIANRLNGVEELPVNATDGYLIIEAGQSNITDRSPISGNLSSTLQALQPDTWTFFKQVDNATDNGFWCKMRSGYNTTAGGGIEGNFGLDVSLGSKLKNSYSKAGYFVPTAVGGTALDIAVTPSWSPAATGEYYDAMITSFQQALAQSTNKSLTPVLIWNQGEYDASVLAYANAYEANLTALFAAIRSDLSLPNLKIIIVELGADTVYTYKNTVRTAQENVAAADANCEIYESPYPIGADGEHYNPQIASYGGVQARQLIGEALADIIKDF